MTKEALKLALEVLENIKNDPFKFDLKNDIDKAIIAIKEALAQPEQEYLAFMDTPQRTWVGLTDEEIEKHWKKQVGTVRPNYSFTRAIESKLKEKNVVR